MISLDDLEGTSGSLDLSIVYSHLNVLEYNTSTLNTCATSLSSEQNVITSNTYNLYNSFTNFTSGGGEGFDYLDKYSYLEHNNLSYGYNISDTLSSAIMNNNVFSGGPNFNWDAMTVSQNKLFNIEGYSFGHNSIYNDSSFLQFSYNYFNNNTFLNCNNMRLSAVEMTGNDINMSGNVSVVADKVSANVFKSMYSLKLDGINQFANSFQHVSNVDMMANNINTWVGSSVSGSINVDCNQLNWFFLNSYFDWTNTHSADRAKEVNLNYNDGIANNVVSAESVNIKCNTWAGVLEDCDQARVSAKTLSHYCISNVKDVHLWFDGIDMPYDDRDIYGISSVSTLHIHNIDKNTYIANWDYNNNPPIALFTNNVKCLDLDCYPPSYLYNNNIWNGANYGLGGFHPSDIYINGVLLTKYNA